MFIILQGVVICVLSRYLHLSCRKPTAVLLLMDDYDWHAGDLWVGRATRWHGTSWTWICPKVIHRSWKKRFYFEGQAPCFLSYGCSLNAAVLACMLRHPQEDFGFPHWNNLLFSSQDQYHPNPTWQRRKLVLPWSGLNRRPSFSIILLI